jgi:hypothetical protein
VNSTVARGRSEPAMSRRETTSAVCVPQRSSISRNNERRFRGVCVWTRDGERRCVCTHRRTGWRVPFSPGFGALAGEPGSRVGRVGWGGDTRGGRTPPYPDRYLSIYLSILPSKQGRLLAGPRRGTARGDRPVSGARRAGGYRLSRLCSGEKTRGVRWSASPAKTQNPATCRGACTKLTMNR